MNIPLQDLISHVNRLPEDDFAIFLNALRAPAPPLLTESQTAEIDRRLAEYLAGDIETVDALESIRESRAELIARNQERGRLEGS
jgi:hypothetical protein